PWTLIPLATDLAAHARFAETPARITRGAELAANTRQLLGHLGTMADSAVDYPVTGMAAHALAQWLLRREPDAEPEPAVRLLALADRFGYNRWFPAMAWEPVAALADEAAPGLLAAVLEEYGERKGRELRPEVERVLAALDAEDLTSSG
ncbi:MAG TPA: hypothetical protein VH085_13655, partial [Nocardioides sp.]|nr:hypothetical protein [Nocardioides sp.]